MAVHSGPVVKVLSLSNNASGSSPDWRTGNQHGVNLIYYSPPELLYFFELHLDINKMILSFYFYYFLPWTNAVQQVVKLVDREMKAVDGEPHHSAILGETE